MTTLVKRIFFCCIITGCFEAAHLQCNIIGIVLKFDENIEAEDNMHNFNSSKNLVIKDQNDYWRLENNSLIANKMIDLDNGSALCGNNYFNMEMGCAGETSFVSLVVVINEKDEYPPKFPDTSYTANATEWSQVGTTVFTLYAEDLDCDQGKFNHIDSYSLDNESNAPIAIGHSQKGTVVTTAELDYESGPNEFTVQVIAKSGNNNGTAELKFYILDIDDENPTFDHPNYKLFIWENSTSAFVWLTADPPIYAYDQDFGLNDTVEYEISDLNILPEMEIHNTNGKLRINKTMDREKASQYNVILVTRQQNNRARTATASLTIIIKDINDNRPHFNSLTYSTSIPEHLYEGAKICESQVTATDADEAPNNNFDFEIISETSVFDIDQKLGCLIVTNSSALDREAKGNFTVVVSTKETEPTVGPNCTEDNCTATVVITLEDINDNTPIFKQEKYMFHVNNTIGIAFGKVKADDADEGRNSEIRYSIDQVTGGDKDSFFVHQDLGDLFLNKRLINDKMYIVIVKACDNPEDKGLTRCASTLVEVTATNTSVSPSEYISANVTENTEIGTTVTQLQLHHGYQYEIQGNVTEFEMNSMLLKTTANIDREYKNEYTVNIDIKNGLDVKGNVTVHITVLDVNDNAPVFGTLDHYRFNLPDDAKTGAVVGNVTATDLDEGTNGIIKYSIYSVKKPQEFAINSETGEITLVTFPKQGATQQYIEMVVVAEDQGEPPLKTPISVKVYVGGENGTVRIHAPVKQNTLEGDKDFLEKEISKILGVTIKIKRISSITSAQQDSSAIYITATNTTDGVDVPTPLLSQLVDDKLEDLMKLFDRYRSSSSDESSVSAAVIALICIGTVILIGGIIVTLILCIKFDRYEKKNRLFMRLSKKNPIYEIEETKVDIIDETSDYSRSESLTTQEFLTNNSSIANGHAVGCVNEGFEDDDQTAQKLIAEEIKDNIDYQVEPLQTYPRELEVQEALIVLQSEDETGEARADVGDFTDTKDNPVIEAQPFPDYDGVGSSDAMEGQTEEDENDDVFTNPTETLPSEVDTETTGEFADNLPADSDAQNEEDIDSRTIKVASQAEEVSSHTIPEESDLPKEVDVADYSANVVDDNYDSLPSPPSPLLPPPTPPLPSSRRAGLGGTETMQDELDADEPEPDYAKKVRFSEQVIEVKEDIAPPPPVVIDTDEEDAALMNKDRQDDEINSPSSDITVEDDEPTFHFESTAL